MNAQQLTQRVRAFDGVADALAQSQWAEKKWVWVADKEEGYINGYITKEDGDNVELHLSNDSVRRHFANIVSLETNG
jgi:hypothetical protein